MEDVSPRIERLVIELTMIPSVVATPGEVEISNVILSKVRSMPYFKSAPSDVLIAETKDDPLRRYSVMAVLRAPAGSDKALLLIGHTDTVGTSDYAGLEACAQDPVRLAGGLRGLTLDDEVAADLESGDYIFGRGTLDMKTGIAAMLCLLSDVSEKTELLDHNLVFAFLPDEEGGSAGMFAALEALENLAVKETWHFIAAIDTDYTTDRHPGDAKKYVYVGSVGKLLPAFYVHGEQLHVGEAFSGLDANFLASSIMRRVAMNPELCDEAEGEVTLPPVVLRMRDTKEEYSVQTAGGCHMYFNFSTQKSNPDEVLSIMVNEAELALKGAVLEISERHDSFMRKCGLPYENPGWEPYVMTYSQLAERVDKETSGGLDKIIQAYCDGEAREVREPRDFSLGLVRHIHMHLKDQGPKVVAYFAPPYYPHVGLDQADEKDRTLIAAIEAAAAKERKRSGYDIVVRSFYPYISDLSYCRLPAEGAAISALTQNMPAWGRRYYLPLRAISRLSVPVANIGPYGKDAHKLTERVCRRYSFDTMPRLLWEAVMNLAGCKNATWIV